MDDDELIAAIAAGDDTALRALFSRHSAAPGHTLSATDMTEQARRARSELLDQAGLAEPDTVTAV